MRRKVPFAAGRDETATIKTIMHKSVSEAELPPHRLRRALLQWFDRSRRDLPWRHPSRRSDPYCVWVSEIMLQQTRVAVVIPYYERFLERFPAVGDLAAAPEADVLSLWSGLGYYRRARQLHAAAHLIVSRHDGRFPLRHADVLSLPGIGRYTAGAILSIADGQCLPAVDGNVVRVASRLLGTSFRTPVETERAISGWVDPGRPGDFNQALMELGATVCLPRQPQCLTCPVHDLCRTRGEHPVTKPRIRSVAVEEEYLLRTAGGRVWLVQRPADADLMPGLWELPAGSSGELLGSVKHAITFRSIHARVYGITSSRKPKGDGRWMAREDALAAPLTGLTRKILRRFLDWKA